MITPENMNPFRNRIYRLRQKRGRNDKLVWFLTKVLRWTEVDMPISCIAIAGGFSGQYTSLDDAFSTNDRGIAIMQDWCLSQCRKKWHYEPTTFMFRSKKDAAIFKLRFYE